MRPTSTNTAFSADVVRLPSATNRLWIFEPENEWRKIVEKRLEQLLRLPVGWDGYKAQPVGFLNAHFALRMLDAICGSGAEAPQIVPGQEGDLQIEWHTRQGDVELHVMAPNKVHAWRNLVGPEATEDELELTNEFSAVAAWLGEIAELPRDVETAAA